MMEMLLNTMANLMSTALLILYFQTQMLLFKPDPKLQMMLKLINNSYKKKQQEPINNGVMNKNLDKNQMC